LAGFKGAILLRGGRGREGEREGNEGVRKRKGREGERGRERGCVYCSGGLAPLVHNTTLAVVLT